MTAGKMVQKPETDEQALHAASRAAMEKEVGEAIRRIIVSAFINMAGLDATVGANKPHTEPADPRNSVTGTIDWAGSWRGIGVLDCTPEFACRLASLMLATEATELDQNALDAVAEMTNIIFGSLKRQLEPIFGRMDLNLPTVSYEEVMALELERPKFMVIPVQIEDHSLRLRLLITQVRGWVRPVEEEPKAKVVVRAA